VELTLGLFIGGSNGVFGYRLCSSKLRKSKYESFVLS